MAYARRGNWRRRSLRHRAVQEGEIAVVVKLVILYRHPDDPAAFEDYYVNQHIPYAAKHMPNVRAAENLRVIATHAGVPVPYYRIAQLTYDSIDDLNHGLASDGGRSTLADLGNFATGGAILLIAEDR